MPSSARDALVTRLLLGLQLTLDERRQLGAFVTRDEVIEAIVRELERDGRFPFEGEPTRIELDGDEARLVRRGPFTNGTERFASAREAAERYVDTEIGPSCGGVRVRR